jgi:predicted HicB family RNase H-like nuclease
MNKNFIDYKNYIAELTLDLEDDIIVGKVINTADIISFHGKTLNEAKQAFHNVLDSYLETALELGLEAAKPCSGKFNLRINPQLHHRLNILAKKQNKSLNDCTIGLITYGLENFDHLKDSYA